MSHRTAGDDRDRDLSPPWILALSAGCLVVTAWLAFTFARSTVLAPSAWTLTLVALRENRRREGTGRGREPLDSRAIIVGHGF